MPQFFHLGNGTLDQESHRIPREEDIPGRRLRETDSVDVVRFLKSRVSKQQINGISLFCLINFSWLILVWSSSMHFKNFSPVVASGLTCYSWRLVSRIRGAGVGKSEDGERGKLGQRKRRLKAQECKELLLY